MKTKFLGIFLVLLAVLSLGIVNAASPYYEISKVEVEDREVTTADTNYIVAERGEEIQVDVWVAGTTVSGSTSLDNVRVKAWIGGYEYGDVVEKSGSFKVESDGVYHETLYLEIPDDMDADDSEDSERYSLNIEVYDKNDYERNVYNLKISEKRHDLRVQDVILRPSNSVKAGERLFTTVRVENMGDKREEDIQVKLSIPELGLEAREYIDKLTPESQQEKNDDVENSDDVDLFLAIPKSAKTGDYKLNVELIYSRGHERVEQDYLLHVEGVREVSQEEALISVDSISKQVATGNEVVYKVMIANFGDVKKTYSAEVVGAGVWGSSSVDPGFVSLNAGETGELYVKVTPNVEGKHPFTVKISESGNVIKEINLNVNVGATTGGDWTRVKHGLEIGFVVLAILLVILGLIIAFNKLKGDDEEERPEVGEEGQTYY